MPLYSDAREFFEAVAEANRDAERVRSQLDALEHNAIGIGGGGFEPRVRSTPAHDRMGEAVASLVDQESALRRRLDEDYALIDLACEVLYGTDIQNGLHALVGWRADALALHYLNGYTWATVGNLLGYTEQHVQRQARVAMETCDTWGIINVIRGRGCAEN